MDIEIFLTVKVMVLLDKLPFIIMREIKLILIELEVKPCRALIST